MNLPYTTSMTSIGAALAVLVAAVVSSCTYSTGEVPSPCPTATETVSYVKDISPIFDTNCRSCHGAAVYQTLGGGNDYSDYRGIKKQSASLLLGSVQHAPGFDPMPKSGAKLAVCDIAKIKAWIDAGQPNN